MLETLLFRYISHTYPIFAIIHPVFLYLSVGHFLVEFSLVTYFFSYFIALRAQHLSNFISDFFSSSFHKQKRKNGELKSIQNRSEKTENKTVASVAFF